MKLSVFSAKPYDKKYLDAAVARAGVDVDVTYHEFPLNPTTATLLQPTDFVSVFVNDALPASVIEKLPSLGVRGVLLRCAGFNNVDLDAAAAASLPVANVPSYSPEAVAEFAVALTQTLNRRTHKAYNRAREGNFALEGLMGRTLSGKTVGVVGTGRIGLAAARIFRGFGCEVLAHDPYPGEELGAMGGRYAPLDEVLASADVLSLHCPLAPSTRHIIDAAALAKMKDGVLLVNTSRGGLVDTPALVAALKSKKVGGVALDVYEDEGGLFYDDHSHDIIHDDVLMRLMTFPNVLVTGHQAFFTEEALEEISGCVLRNMVAIREGGGEGCENELTRKHVNKGEDEPVRNV
ncbi:hypothetical protein N3K66_000281 [Trichothecium roseum]|uniref:Uncharacterized protein n=1 Tax=Trichothecium roseum TaxID=47278 RepID=A0ACC0VBI6_9HYPO|nr:hypothetical protein N3K66_000281 [Trichothecium roseum]